MIVFRKACLDAPHDETIGFIDIFRDRLGVEPICLAFAGA